MAAPKGQWVALLDEALAQPVGLLLKTNDFKNARLELYKARAACADPKYAVLAFRASPWAEGNLVIVRMDAGPGALTKRRGRPSQVTTKGFAELELE